MYCFYPVVVAVFGQIYLRKANEKYTCQIMVQNKVRAFRGMEIACNGHGNSIFLARLYKIHIEDEKNSLNLTCFLWHGGSHKNINLLQCSLMFARLVKGHAREVNYEINRHSKPKGIT
jgi:hypothetical protein